MTDILNNVGGATTRCSGGRSTTRAAAARNGGSGPPLEVAEIALPARQWTDPGPRIVGRDKVRSAAAVRMGVIELCLRH